MGAMTSPGRPHLLALEAPNLLISSYPLVMVPTFAVPLALMLHGLVLWRLSFEYAHMLMFEWILSPLFAAVVLTNLAERLAVPYPSLLAVAGTELAFLPFAPQIRIEPDGSIAFA